ncbi:MAG: chemotaxis protein CheA [Gemmatimonadota bacterium]|nr:chemotaxis protein CheA [Gemmatimonadota bacterium]
MALDASRYAELFRSESQDQLQTINRALLTIESARGDASSAATAAAVAEVFRAVHTVKGMSATMGYQAVAEYAHELESLLDRMRGEGAAVTMPVMDALFAAADALEHGIGEASEAAPRTEAMTNALHRLSGAFRAAGGENAVSDAARTGVTPGAAHRASGALHRVSGAVAAEPLVEADSGPTVVDPFDGPGVIIRIRQSATTTLPGVRAFIVTQKLAAIGEVAAVSPPLEQLQAAEAPQGFAVRLVTGADAAAIEAAVRSAGDVDTVHVDMLGRARKRAAGPADEPIAETTSARVRQVKIDLSRLDTMMNLVGELVIARGRLVQLTAGSPDPALDESVTQMAHLVGELQREITASRMVPVGQVFDRFPRMVRDAARGLGKDVRFEVEGRDIELDRSLLDEMAEPLVHLLRNAIDHGLEGPAERTAEGKPAAGTLFLSATRERSAVVIRVQDDGRGINRARVLERARVSGLVDAGVRDLDDADLLRCLAHPGFSTKDSVTGLSGRGVGVDAVVNKVRSLGGSVELHTALGAGSSFTLRLPLTVAIVRALLARAGGEHYALPLTHVRETLEWGPDSVRQVNGTDVLVLRDEVLPLVDLRDVVQLRGVRAANATREIVVVERGERRTGLVVDELLGQDEIVVKQFDAARGEATAAGLFTGATILADGAPALIMDLASLL